jgi:hypothetical protein
VEKAWSIANNRLKTGWDWLFNKRLCSLKLIPLLNCNKNQNPRILKIIKFSSSEYKLTSSPSGYRK